MTLPVTEGGAAAELQTRFVTLAQARALECNGCGDCCDSRRTDGFWTWGSLPLGQYREQCGGEPLIIPLERIAGEWRDREPRPEDGSELSGTRFRCSAFQPRADGGGGCGRHDQWRPPRCGEFPVGGDAVALELEDLGEVRLQAASFSRCTWYGMVVVREGDSRLEA